MKSAPTGVAPLQSAWQLSQVSDVPNLATLVLALKVILKVIVHVNIKKEKNRH